MIAELLTDLFESSPPWFTSLVQTSLKATVLLGAAALVVLALRHASARARHLALTLSVAGALALPLIALLVPAWRLPLLAARAPASEPPVIDFDAPATLPDLEPAEWSDEATPALATTFFVGPPATTVEPSWSWAGVKSVVESARPRLTWDVWVLAMWLSGMGMVLARMLLHRLRVWQLKERARPIVDERRDLAFAVMAREGFTRRVELLESDDFDMPITWGFLKPVIVLPASSATWRSERVEVALLHELAHVRRFDALTQLLAQLACAFYWFHPLSWFAALKMQVLREFACDAEVIERGARPSQYAREVLGIVEAIELRQRLGTATLPMAQKASVLRERLLAVLQMRASEAGRRASRGRTLLSVLGVVCLVSVLASLELARAEPLPRLTPQQAKARIVTVPSTPSPAVPAAPSVPAVPEVAAVPELPALPSLPDLPTQGDPDAKAERTTRALIEDAARSQTTSQGLAAALKEIADDERLDSEPTRQAFLKAAARLTENEHRLQALKALLAGAPISTETGRGVLTEARKLTSDQTRAELLQMMHRIRESELVRGPLAKEYLDLTEQLTGEEPLARALQKLLHPEPIPPEATTRALQQLSRVRDPKLRRDVLIEVTDHQAITPEIEALYRKLIEPMPDAQRRDALERLVEATDESKQREVASSDADAIRSLVRAKLKGEQARRFERELEKLDRARDRLREQAERMTKQAIELDQRMKDLAKQLDEHPR